VLEGGAGSPRVWRCDGLYRRPAWCNRLSRRSAEGTCEVKCIGIDPDDWGLQEGGCHLAKVRAVRQPVRAGFARLLSPCRRFKKYLHLKPDREAVRRARRTPETSAGSSAPLLAAQSPSEGRAIERCCHVKGAMRERP